MSNREDKAYSEMKEQNDKELFKDRQQRVKDIQAVVSYLWYDEQKHFLESDKPKSHIFRKLQRLNEGLSLGLN